MQFSIHHCLSTEQIVDVEQVSPPVLLASLMRPLLHMELRGPRVPVRVQHQDSYHHHVRRRQPISKETKH